MNQGARVLFPDPAWYEPLRAPSWLLPSLRDGAVPVLFAPEDDAPCDDEALRQGLPLALAEAVRYSSDADTSASLAARDGTATHGLLVRTGLVGGSGERAVGFRVLRGAEVLDEAVHPAPDDAALGAVLAGLPSEVVGVLREAGIRPVWATAYAAPAPARAASYVRAHHGCAWLQEPTTFAPADEPDQQGVLRARVRSVLALTAAHATRDGGPLGAALFLAAVAATKAGGSPLYMQFRVQANPITLAERNPRDPMSLLSVVASALFGESHAAEQRATALGASAEPDVKRWLARARTIG
jgi:hypothetical protein